MPKHRANSADIVSNIIRGDVTRRQNKDLIGFQYRASHGITAHPSHFQLATQYHPVTR